MKTDRAREKIFNAVLAADVAKGHLKWKVSDIARSTGMSRPLIYYHFGTTKSAILLECLNVIATEYYGLTPEREQMLRAGQALESILKTRAMLAKNPALAVFYQKWRAQKSPLQKELIAIEKRYQRKLAIVFPALSPTRISAIHGLFHGLVTAPFLDETSVREALLIIRGAFAE